jgi:glyoxylase-like metal-dependent hydrolase (beta-lactamase superfamily II)
MDVERLTENLFRIASGCSVYVVRRGTGAVAIDLGDGRWLAELPRLGVDRLDHVFLTHHHADQCSARSGWRSFPAAAGAVLHAPVGEETFLEPERARTAAAAEAHLGIGCPPSYSILPDGLPGVRYDMAGFSDIFWENRRIRFIHTPGHSRAACSVLLDADGRQALFAGDAAHAGAAVWEPWHLEWDHWTGSGALAAWEGIERLRGIAIDCLCPSHGPAVRGRRAAARLLARLSRKLLAWYRCKGSMAGPASDAYVAPEAAAPSWRQYSPSLFQFGMNGYLLRSRGGRTLAIDPAEADLHALAELRSRLGAPTPSLCAVTHYHADHCDGIPALRRDGARLVLHPWVQEPLRDVRGTKAPWLPHEDLLADEVWPESGTWTWEEFAFRVAPFPGQTLWHCTFAARIDGRLIAFTGDTFQPASRWNGTGGFCAYNRSLFRGGFADSARLLLSWSPDWLAAGHGTVSRFDPARFRAVVRWARRARRATRALCPTGDLEREYYAWGTGEHGRRP